MKKILIGTGVFVLVFFIVVLVIGFMQPRVVHIERSRDISADRSLVFSTVNRVSEWTKWSPWYEKDPQMKITYTGAESGIGAGYSWESENKDLGKGTLKITESKTDEFVKEEMDFRENGKATAVWKFQPIDNGTRVIWSMESDMGNNPLMRLMGMMFDKWVGEDFEKGLEKLAAYVENMPSHTQQMDMDTISTTGIDTISALQESEEAL